MDDLNKISADFNIVAGLFAGCGVLFGYIATATAPIPGLDFVSVPTAGSIALVCGIDSALFWVGGGVAQRAAVDPLSPNFKVVAAPSPPHVPTVKPGAGLNVSVTSAVNAVLENLANSDGLLAALLTTMERAQGAANARSTVWVKKQSTAAASFATSLSVSFRELVGLLSNARRELQAEHVPAPVLSAKDWGIVVQYVKKHGLPSKFVSQIRALGLGTQAIEKIRNSILKAHTSLLTTSLIALLGNPQLTKALNGAAQTFSSYAEGIRRKLATLAPPTTSRASGPNLLANSCFRDPALGSSSYTGESAGSTAIPDWAVGGGGVQPVGTYWKSSPGCAESLWLANDHPGWVSQRVATTPGTPYLLRWWVGGSLESEDPNPLHVLWGGTQVAVQKVTGRTWQPGEVVLTATTAHTILEFSATLSAADGGPAIGSASLTQA